MAAEQGNRRPIADLFNLSNSLTVDASALTSHTDLEEVFDGISALLTVGMTYIDSAYDVWLVGTPADDRFNLGDPSSNNFKWIIIEATDGDDIYDGTNVGTVTFVTLDYDQDYSPNPSAITVTLDGVANTGSITGTGFTDTLIDVTAILSGDGLEILGSHQNDIFNIIQADYGLLYLVGGEGVDRYNITLTDRSVVALDFFDGAYDDPTQGVQIDLGQGTITNDGFGNTETLNVTHSGGRLQIRGTPFDDDITGSGHNDLFRATPGNDTIDGGAGIDWMSYGSDGPGFVHANLAIGTVEGFLYGEAFNDDLTTIERIRGTDYGADILTGSAENNVLIGGGGNDQLNGAGGDDTLVGGQGNDLMIGGAGTDTVEISAEMGDLRVVSRPMGLSITSRDGTDFVTNDIEFIELWDTTVTYASLAASAQTARSVRYTITGENANFLAFALEESDDLELVGTRNATQFTLRNTENNAQLLFSGTGFTYSGGIDPEPTGGTITSIAVSLNGRSLGTVSNVRLDLLAFLQAIQDYENFGDPTAVGLFFNGGLPLRVNAARASSILYEGDTATETALSPFIDALDGIIYTASRYQDDIIGSAGDDVFRFTTDSPSRPFHRIEATDGSDIYDFSITDTRVGLAVNYDQDFASTGNIPLVADIDATANSGEIAYGNFKDIFRNVARAMDDNGLFIAGTHLDDRFNIVTKAGSRIGLALLGGEDTVNASVAAGSTLSLYYNFGGSQSLTEGVDVDLRAGKADADGLLSNDVINIVNRGQVRLLGSTLRTTWRAATGTTASTVKRAMTGSTVGMATTPSSAMMGKTHFMVETARTGSTAEGRTISCLATKKTIHSQETAAMTASSEAAAATA